MPMPNKKKHSLFDQQLQHNRGQLKTFTMMCEDDLWSISIKNITLSQMTMDDTVFTAEYSLTASKRTDRLRWRVIRWRDTPWQTNQPIASRWHSAHRSTSWLLHRNEDLLFHTIENRGRANRSRQQSLYQFTGWNSSRLNVCTCRAFIGFWHERQTINLQHMYIDTHTSGGYEEFII